MKCKKVKRLKILMELDKAAVVPIGEQTVTCQMPRGHKGPHRVMLPDLSDIEFYEWEDEDVSGN